MIKEAYELGVRQALEDAGLIKESNWAIADKDYAVNAKKGFEYGAMGGLGVSVAGLLASLISKGKYGIPPYRGAVYGPALLGAGIGAGIGALKD